MSLYDQMNLANQPGFQGRVAAAAVDAAQNIISEVLPDVQTLSMGAVTAGTFTLNFLGQTTAALQWNSSALAIQTALNALTTIGAGGVECTGGPLPGTPVVVNFTGSMVGAFPLIGHTDTLTGGVLTVTHTTVGTWVSKHAQRAAFGKLVVSNPTGYGQLMALGVAASATVLADFPGPTYLPGAGVTEAQITTDINAQMSGIWNNYI